MILHLRSLNSKRQHCDDLLLIASLVNIDFGRYLGYIWSELRNLLEMERHG